MFSPYYAWSGRARPLDHCALNVCLYGPRGRRWAMTERRAGAVTRAPDALSIGPSAARFEDGALVFDVAERGAPIPRAVRGQVVFRPEIEQGETFTLDPGGRHVWRPAWPRARVSVRLDAPDLDWDGEGYVDMNAGAEPLEAAFASWHWSRAPLSDGAGILYDCRWRNGDCRVLALRIGADGRAEHAPVAASAPLPRTGWGIDRETRCNAGARVLQTLEDTPFYARSLVETDAFGSPGAAMHESLDLDRFASGWVKMLLPFRMPRAF